MCILYYNNSFYCVLFYCALNGTIRPDKRRFVRKWYGCYKRLHNWTLEVVKKILRQITIVYLKITCSAEPELVNVFLAYFRLWRFRRLPELLIIFVNLNFCNIRRESQYTLFCYYRFCLARKERFDIGMNRVVSNLCTCTVYISRYFLKVVGIEKEGRSGKWQMIDIGLGLWW